MVKTGKIAGVKTKSILWTKGFVVLNIVNTFSAFGFFLIYPIMSKYLVILNAPLTLAGIIIGLLSTTAMFVRPFSGVAADRYNKKNIYFISSLVMGICVLGYVITKDIAVILLFRIFNGVALGIAGTSSVALVSEYIPQERMGEGIGYFSFGSIIAATVGPGLGIITSNLFGFTITFLISSMLSVFSALLIIPVKRSHFNQSANPKRTKIDFKSLIAKEAVYYSIIATFISITSAMVGTFLVLVADQRHVKNISLYFIVSGIFIILVRPFAGKILDRKGLSVLFYPSFAMIIVALIIDGLASTLWMFLLAAALISIGQGCIAPSLQAECVRKAGVHRSGVASSTYFIGQDFAQGIGPVAAGLIASLFHYTSIFYFSVVLMFLGCVLFYLYGQKEKRQMIA